MSDNLERELVDMILDICSIDDVAVEDVGLDAPLIGPESPLELDSLDAVEVVVSVQKTYNVRIGGEGPSREALQSVKSLANYIRKEQQ